MSNLGPGPGLGPLLWCCAGCIRGSDDSTEYYTLLGLTPSATQEEIRKAWRRLSLKMHPDKLRQRGQEASADTAALFNRVKDAHSVLSDPSHRRTYDKFGANGVKWIEDPATIDPQVIAHNFTHSTLEDRCRIITMFATLAAVLLLFPVLLCKKLDAEVQNGWLLGGGWLPWTAVFAPLFLLEAVWLALQCTALVAVRKAYKEATSGGSTSAPSSSSRASSYGKAASSSNDSAMHSSSEDEEEGRAKNERGEPHAHSSSHQWEKAVGLEVAWAGVVHTGLSLAWQALVCSALSAGDHGQVVSSGRFAVSLLPLLLAEGLQARHQKRMVELAEERPSARIDGAVDTSSKDEEVGDEGNTPLTSEQEATRVAMAKTAERSTIAHVLRALTVVLVMLKLGLFGYFSWWFVLAPLWALFAFEIAADALTAVSAAAAAGTPASTSLSSEEEASAKTSKVAGAACHACCGVGFAVLVTTLSAAKLSGASFSACWIFAPIFAAASVAMLCITLVVCCAIDPNSITDDSDGGSNGATSPYAPLRSDANTSGAPSVLPHNGDNNAGSSAAASSTSRMGRSPSQEPLVSNID